jgi:hypothetical protein
VTSLLLAILLPMIQSYYSYSLVPLVILLSAAALVAGVEMMMSLPIVINISRGARLYGRTIACCTIVAVLALGSGILLDLRELPGQTVFLGKYSRFGQWKFFHLQGPATYVAEHLQPGDVVISLLPETFSHYAAASDAAGARLKSPLCDYATETSPSVYMLLPDSRPTPIFRTHDTPVITTLDGLKGVFARHRRVWYVTVPLGDLAWNNPATRAYIEDNTDIVYQDYRTAVMLRDAARPALGRRADRQELSKAGLTIVP